MGLALLFQGGGAGGITGTLSVTLGALTSSATGTVKITGQSAVTLAALTGSATGTIRIQGTASATLAAATLAATGTVKIQGTSSIGLAAATLVATGTVSGGGIQATLTATLAPMTLNAFGRDQHHIYKSVTGSLVTWDLAALAHNHARIRRLARWSEIYRLEAVYRYSGTVGTVLIVDLHGVGSRYVRQDIAAAIMQYCMGWTQT